MAKNYKQLEFDFMKQEEKKEKNYSFKIGGYTVIYNYNIYNSIWDNVTSNSTSGASYISNSSTGGIYYGV